MLAPSACTYASWILSRHRARPRPRAAPAAGGARRHARLRARPPARADRQHVVLRPARQARCRARCCRRLVVARDHAGDRRQRSSSSRATPAACRRCLTKMAEIVAGSRGLAAALARRRDAAESRRHQESPRRMVPRRTLREMQTDGQGSGAGARLRADRHDRRRAWSRCTRRWTHEPRGPLGDGASSSASRHSGLRIPPRRFRAGANLADQHAVHGDLPRSCVAAALRRATCRFAKRSTARDLRRRLSCRVVGNLISNTGHRDRGASSDSYRRRPRPRSRSSIVIHKLEYFLNARIVGTQIAVARRGSSCSRMLGDGSRVRRRPACVAAPIYYAVRQGRAEASSGLVVS